MKSFIPVALAALALSSGCIRPPGGGEGAFSVEFAAVDQVIVNSWGDARIMRPVDITDPGTSPAGGPQTVRIEGSGSVNKLGGQISLSFSVATDVLGCQALAEQAQRERRALRLEGYGTVS